MRMRNHNTSDRALVLGIKPKCMDMHRIWGKTTPTLGGGLHTEPSTAVWPCRNPITGCSF